MTSETIAMGAFETKLKETYVKYSDLLTRLRSEEICANDFYRQANNLMVDAFQSGLVTLLGKGVRDSDFGCNARIALPGLQTHLGIKGSFNGKGCSYHGRKGVPPLHHSENGWGDIKFFADSSSYLNGGDKVSINFFPYLDLPKTAKRIEKTAWSEKFELNGNMVCINREYERGSYFLGGKVEMDEDDVEDLRNPGININARGTSIRDINILSERLGGGMLTSFFKDVDYTGLDKLVEGPAPKKTRIHLGKKGRIFSRRR